MKITHVVGETFADIMMGVNGAKIPEDGPKIDRFLKTKKGDLLIKFKGQASSNTVATEALKAAVRVTGELKSLSATTTVRVFDLNSGNAVYQVQEVVKKVTHN